MLGRILRININLQSAKYSVKKYVTLIPKGIQCDCENITISQSILENKTGVDVSFTKSNFNSPAAKKKSYMKEKD